MCVCVCVLTSIWGRTVWPNYGVFFQASFSDCSNPRICRSFLCILPSPSSFPNPRHSHHTGSYSHLCVPCIRPSISNCNTRAFIHMGVARLLTSIPITHQDLLSLQVAVLLHAHIPTAPPPPFSFLRICQGGLKFFSVASWRYHAFFLCPPHSYPVTLVPRLK